MHCNAMSSGRFGSSSDEYSKHESNVAATAVVRVYDLEGAKKDDDDKDEECLFMALRLGSFQAEESCPSSNSSNSLSISLSLLLLRDKLLFSKFPKNKESSGLELAKEDHNPPILRI
ncbi:hypothetical protein NE237_028773 [Protea cynaroides]|uniref:Uncharacterized protein n=1 Tax=Protea cynaroides TaxID=273540 RepID=A0A9Q0GRU3_9MAGN|nr:hypothetical protein NE237_028773 [Protea cynaroides]